MTNKELQEQFRQITLKYDNIFDVYMSLNQYIKEYKTTPYYQTTKQTIYEAFDLYMRGIGFVDYMLSLLKHFDDKDFINLLNRITETFSIDGILNTMEDKNKELFNNLLPFVKPE